VRPDFLPFIESVILSGRIVWKQETAARQPFGEGPERRSVVEDRYACAPVLMKAGRTRLWQRLPAFGVCVRWS